MHLSAHLLGVRLCCDCTPRLDTGNPARLETYFKVSPVLKRRSRPSALTLVLQDRIDGVL